MIDIKGIYMVGLTIIVMIVLSYINLKNIVKFKTVFWNIILGFEILLGTAAFAYILALFYKAMEDYQVFVQKYGYLDKYIMYLAYYYCIAQLGIYIFVILKKASIKRFRI